MAISLHKRHVKITASSYRQDVTLCWMALKRAGNPVGSSFPVLPNPRFRRPIGLLLTSAPRLSKPYRYFATFVLLLTYLPRNVLEIGRLCEKLSISCQFRGILNFFNVNEQINHKLIGWRRHIEPSKSFESDYPQLPEVGQSIVFPPIWVIFG